MRILHILDHSIPLHSGYTFRTLSIIEQQRKLGWETCHITSTKHYVNKEEEEEVDGLHFYRTFTRSSLLAKLPVLNQLAVVKDLSKRLQEVVAKEKPDILHAHSPCLNGLAALNVAKKNGLPVVYEMRASWEDAAVDHGTTTEGNLRYKLSRALETYVLRRVDAITTICDGLKNDIISRDISGERITVIPNAVDIEKFTVNEFLPNNELVEKLQLLDKCVLGFIGSFYAYEGLSLLLDALPLIIKKIPNVHLLLVGGGLQEGALKAQTKSLGLEANVTFVGRVPHDEVQRYYDLVEVFVYPRLSMRLTELVTPLKPLEAMAQGRLVVASDVGGHKELIDDGSNGLLFKAGSAVDLSRVVVEFLQNSESWSQFRLNGREYVEKERNWGKSVSRYRQVYNSLQRKPGFHPLPR